MAEEKNITGEAQELCGQGEQPLQRGERRFRALVENLSEAIALLGPDGSFIYASPSASRINGYPMQEFMGKSAFEIIHPDDRALVAQHFQQIQQIPGASTALLIRLRHRDGSWRWIDAMATNQLEDPAIGAIIINYRDITDRKQAVETLENRETLLNAMGKMARVGGWELDTVTGRQVWTDEVYGIHELDMSYQPTGEMGIQFYAPSARPIIERAVRRAIDFGEPFDLELEFITAKGNKLWVHSIGKAHLENGKAVILYGTFQDITDRKQAENLLRIQHDLFLKLSTVRDLQETLRLCLDAALRVSGLDCGGIYLTDDAGGIRLSQSAGVSDAFVKEVCYYPADAANTHLLMKGAALYMSRSDLEKALSEKKRREGLRAVAIIPIWKEKRIIGAMNVASHSLDDIPMYCRVALETIASSIGLLIDRAQADEELVRAKAEWERTFDAVPDLIALIDRDYRIIRVNRAMAERTGKEPRQLVGSYCFEAMHGLSAPPDFCPHTKMLASGKEERTEVDEKRFNGIFDVIVTPLCDGAGRLTGSVHVAHDITERKREEEEVRESRAKLEAAMASMSDAVFISDAQGNLIDLNDAFATFHKFKSKEECARNLADYPALLEVFLPDGELASLDMWAIPRALRGETGINAEYGLRRKDTGERWFGSYSFAPIRDVTGAIVGSVVVGRDITERKLADEELQVSHDQLRALAASLQTVREEERTRVARDIHDVLAQELTRLKIDLVWLQGRLLKSGKGTAQETLATRVGEMTRMADAAIQCVQRIATGLRPAVLDSLGLCAAVEWQARDFQNHSGIQCNANVTAEELHVGSDAATAVFRILQESLTNVQRHANATQVDIVLRQEAGQLFLRICDNGCGIPAWTLSSPMSIGLTGMKERALLLGGQFEIRSQPESGTTVEVHLPLAKNANVASVKS